MEKLIIGNLEKGELPELGISDIDIRVDTGATTSSLHVDELKPFYMDGVPWVSFDIHPHVYQVEDTQSCKVPVHDRRLIKSSNGETEERVVIQTLLALGPLSWPILLTLTDRSAMRFPMLLGREGMGGRVLVDPSQEFLLEGLSKN